MAESLVHKYFGHITKETKRSIEHPHGAVRHGGESLLGGLALGAIHAEKGLDIKGKVPADLLGAAIGYWLAGKDPMGFGDDIRTLAGTSMSAFGFRQGFAFMDEKKRAKGGTSTPFRTLGSTMHGDFAGEFGESFATDVGEDPIVSLAKSL
jgi:hypothetical protein